MTLSDDFAAVGTATVAEAWNTSRIMDDPPYPLVAGMALAGSALTDRCRPGENLALHRVIAALPSDGGVLAVDYAGCLTSGPFGEIMAVACQVRGVVGLIIDGAVRDSLQIANMGFPVFARGKNIRGTEKRAPGELNIPVKIGGGF